MCANPGHCGDDVRNSYGVSIVFPWIEWDEDAVIAGYAGLEFLKATGWNEFLRKYRKQANDFERGTGAFLV